MLKLITELTILIIGIWTISKLWDMPKEYITPWKEIKKAQETAISKGQ